MTGPRKLILATLAALTFGLSVSTLTGNSAHAQQLCLIRDNAIDQLAKQYGEKIAGRGLTADGKGMVELLTSENGSWTLVVTDVNGRSCVIGTGEAWTSVEPLHGVAS